MKENTQIKVNNKVLIWARETLALSHNLVSKKTGISSKRILELEEGEDLPTIDELKEFSKLYKRTLATLLLNEPPTEKPIPKDRRTVDSKSIGNFHPKTILAIRKARAMANSFIELRNEFGFSINKLNFFASIQENPKTVAYELHKLLNLSEIRNMSNIDLALEGYIEKIESLGVLVFQLSLTQDNLRGFSIVDETMPIIGIKRGGEPTTSKIFTLFHELGHILLNDSGLCDLTEFTNIEIEKWCNAFAAEILIPTTELLQIEKVIEQKQNALNIWTKKDLIEIGNHFHSGPLAILRCLLENNLTTKDFYQEKHQQWNKPHFGKSKKPEGRNIPKETIKEKGRTYISLAFKAFDQNRIDLKDLSDFLGVKFSYISRTRQLLNA